jgi:hypothetical protein
LNFGVTKGQEYRIAVAGVARSEGRIELDLKYTQPAYDRFADAHLIKPGYFGFDYNAGGQSEPGEPKHGENGGGSSIWFSWEAPDDGVAKMRTQADFDTVLAVYRGDSVSTLTPVAANDDAASDGSSAVKFNARKGTVYRIAVDGEQSDAGTAWGLARVFVDFEAGAVDEEPPAEEPPADEPPAEAPPAEKPPADVLPNDDPPVEKPPADDPQVGDPPVGDPPAEAPPAEDSPPVAQEEQHAEPPAQESAQDDARTSASSSNGITAGDPAVMSEPPPPAAAPPSVEPLRLQATFSAQTWKAVLKSGLAGNVSCRGAPCAVELAVLFDPSTAKKLGLRAAGAPFGAVTVQANGPTKFVLKPSAAVKRKLALLKQLKLTVRFTARSGGQTATVERKLTLKR